VTYWRVVGSGGCCFDCGEREIAKLVTKQTRIANPGNFEDRSDRACVR
jgi:hypothetical protein